MRLAVALLCLGSAACAAPPEAGRPEAGRLRPPDAVGCARDHLTAYVGRVVAYQRGPRSLSLRIRTDWDTTEEVRLSAPEGGTLARRFLLDGAPFGDGDWAAIETGPGRLRPSMRAAAWVCDDGSPPLIDWRPGTGGPASSAPR